MDKLQNGPNKTPHFFVFSLFAEEIVKNKKKNGSTM